MRRGLPHPYRQAGVRRHVELERNNAGGGGGGVQLSGSALRMGADDVSLAMSKLPVFRRLLLRYVQLVLVQTSQLAACNAAHPLKQRLARWLLAAPGLERDPT